MPTESIERSKIQFIKNYKNGIKTALQEFKYQQKNKYRIRQNIKLTVHDAGKNV